MTAATLILLDDADVELTDDADVVLTEDPVLSAPAPVFPGVASNPPLAEPYDWQLWVRAAANVTNRMNLGKINARIDVTLSEATPLLLDDVEEELTDDTGVVLTDDTGAGTSTVITDPRLTWSGVCAFDPLTANAAAELAAGTLFVTDDGRANGSWTVSHASNEQTDRSFRMLLIG